MNSKGVHVQVIEPTATKGVCLVERRNIYGNALYYPSNETARIFAELVGKKTLDTMDFRRIKRLGFIVELSVTGGIEL